MQEHNLEPEAAKTRTEEKKLVELGDGEPSPPPHKPRVFLDMDGVVVDFESYKNALSLTGDEVKKRPGAYLNMKPYPEAIKAIKWLVGAGYDVWLATKPPTGIAFAYADKADWVFRNLPELRRKLIITHDKGLLGDTCDFLVDDRPHKANCERFKGTLIPFINGETWENILAKIRSGAAQDVSPPSPEPVCPMCCKPVFTDGYEGDTRELKAALKDSTLRLEQLIRYTDFHHEIAQIYRDRITANERLLG